MVVVARGQAFGAIGNIVKTMAATLRIMGMETTKPRFRGASCLLHTMSGKPGNQPHGSCRIMVWSRSGPVETMLTGQPATSSSARR